MSSRSFSFRQEINGRAYRIDVSLVNNGCWRAEVVTLYGGPTALMPFYGASPDAARDCLTAWLSCVHGAPESTA